MKNISSLLLILAIAFYVKAQKLPGIQSISLRTPSNIKIDGKADEWNNKFQAYNRAVDLFYTIANDDENLYLVIHSDKPRIIQKIINVGVTLTVCNFEKKADDTKGAISITYPIINLTSGLKLLSAARADDEMPVLGSKDGGADTSFKLKTFKKIDSGINEANKLLKASSKLIVVRGKSVLKPDSSLSIYNEQGIRVANLFDNTGGYTYELIVPISYFGITPKKGQYVNYNIKLNSRLSRIQKGMMVRYTYPIKGGGPVDKDIDLDSITDFGGVYTLISK